MIVNKNKIRLLEQKLKKSISYKISEYNSHNWIIIKCKMM